MENKAEITLVIGGCRSGKSRFALDAADQITGNQVKADPAGGGAKNIFSHLGSPGPGNGQAGRRPPGGTGRGLADH